MSIFAILFLAAFVVPFWRLLPRYGIASPWALIAVIPIGTLALLYIMAFMSPDRSA